MISIKSGLSFEDEIMLLIILALVKDDPGPMFKPSQDPDKPVLERCKAWNKLKDDFDISMTNTKLTDEKKQEAQRIFPRLLKTAESKQYIRCVIKEENGELVAATFNPMNADQFYFMVTLAGREIVQATIKRVTQKLMIIIVGVFLLITLFFTL